MGRPKLCNRCRKPKRPGAKEFKEAPGYCECGRPPKIDEKMLEKLEQAFMDGLNDEQACAEVNINPQTLYNYQEKNPEFVERKRQLKLRPDITAKKTIVKNLDKPEHAWRWTERRDPDFKPVSKIEHSGVVEVADGSVIISDEEKSALAFLQQARRKRIENSVKEETNHNEIKTEPHKAD
jgi:hypothetical protein